MITKQNFKQVLAKLNFEEKNNIFIKIFNTFDCELKIDFDKEIIIYPENTGLIINERQTCNFKANENFVVFECVNRLLEQGYNPKHIELEPKWQVGHGASGGRADILVKDNSLNSILIIECKTAGVEFNKAWKETLNKPTQLFSYAQQTRTTQFLALYTSDFVDNKIKSDYYLISLKDNDDFLKNNSKLKSFKESTTVEEIYQIWSETYSKDYATLGLFEDNEAYKIGKDKFCLNDLKIVSSKDIQGKYHEFATILRQHNVGTRERSFDNLVNLFLCKVLDETNNSSELKFYWKGKAYDDPFDLQDRLSKLYKDGMEKFLNDKIVYVDNSEIDNAFRVFKNKPNATKDIIKDLLRQQKFFTNNAFSFIDVHNEELFYKNFEVLLKIVKIFQDIKLTGGEENQFLGDMFEGFLDQGVKQSEGQFFTPMPIVKFIINSLPKIKNPLVIDYACGAGHFLNEYALKHKDSSIVGIEKEYRLSKVAKVSAFMYGNDDMKIVYADALATNKEIKDNTFDVLVANPPYSVKGFLETLSEEDRQKFELIQNIDKKTYSTNNSIECFFIEKAKQLLKDDGVCAIIVPSSILNKGSKVYVQTREIILKYFNIIAIYESGSGTFGKTGTNTVTLFLKKKKTKPTFADHLKNMVESWFEGDFETNENFENDEILQRYCKHNEFNFEEYKEFLTPPAHSSLPPQMRGIEGELQNTDIFKEYKADFDKQKSRDKDVETKYFLSLQKYIKEIEKEKVYYFGLAYNNETDVIIVKSPAGNNEIKKFLGYEWSNSKGSEGIKYITKTPPASLPLHLRGIEGEVEDLEDDDKRVLENINSLGNIETPLYNPKNADDESKINVIIRKNFENNNTHNLNNPNSKENNPPNPLESRGDSNYLKAPILGVWGNEIPQNLKEFVTKARLIDMLDFKRVSFDKAISLNVSRKIEIESKYDLVKIGEICKSGRGRVIDKKYIDNNLGEYPVYSSQTSNNGVFGKINTYDFEGDYVTWTTDGIYAGTCSFRNGKFNCTNVCGTLKAKSNNINMRFLPYVLNQVTDFHVIKSANPKLMNNVMENIKIPLPPLEIQEKIVLECEKVDNEVEKAKNLVEDSKKEIEEIIGNVEGEMVKLGEIAEIQSGGTPKRDKNEYWNGNIPWLRSEVCKDNYIYENQVNEKITQLGLEKSSARIFKEDTILVAMVGATIGKVGYLTFESTTNQNIAGIFPIDFNKISSKYLYNQIKNLYPEFMKIGEGKFVIANLSFIKNLKIPLPNSETQKQIVSKIEKIEEKINIAKKIIDEAKGKKEEILKKFL